MLQNLNKQIDHFIDNDEQRTAYEILSITLKFLYQAKPHQLQTVTVQDLTKLYELIEKLKDTKSDIGFLAGNYHHLLEVVESLGQRFNQDRQYLVLRANLKAKNGACATRESYAADISKSSQAVKPALVHAHTRQMLKDTGIKFTISALRDYENAGMNAEIEKCKREIQHHELRTWQSVVRGRPEVAIKPSEVSALVTKLEVDRTTTPANWLAEFNKAKEFATRCVQQGAYDEAREVFTYFVNKTPGRECPEFNIQELCATLETINDAQLKFSASIQENIHKEKPMWERHREQLKTVRETAKAQLAKGLPVQFVQQELRAAYLEILKDIFAVAEKCLGASPVPYVLSVSGSMARADGSPYSDIEGLMIAKEKNKAFLTYMERVLKLFNYEMELIGENIGTEAAGFRLDAPIRVVSVADLMTMGIETLAAFPAYVKNTMHEDIARLKPHYVHGDAELFAQVQQSVPTLELEQIKKFLVNAAQQFDAEKPKGQNGVGQEKVMSQSSQQLVSVDKNSPQQQAQQSDATDKNSSQPLVNIKKAYLQPLGVICSALAQLYQLPVESSGHPLDILLILAAHAHIDKKFVETFRTHMSWLYKTRLQLQLEKGLVPDHAMDLVPYSPEFAKIDEELVKPLQEMIKRIALATGQEKELGTFPLGMDGFRFALNKEKTCAHYCNMAEGDKKLGDFKGAVDYLNIALALNPRSGDAYVKRGFCHLKLGNNELVISDITKALEFGFVGKQDAAVFQRGEAYLRKGLAEKALVDFTYAAEKVPTDGNYIQGRAEAYVKMQKYELALEEYARILQIPEKKVAGYINRGLLYKKLHRFEDAQKDFEEAIKIEPTKENAHGNLANLLFDTKRYQEALDGLQKVFKINPNSIQATHMYAEILRKLGREDEAKIYFDKLEQLKKNPAPALKSAARPIVKNAKLPVSGDSTNAPPSAASSKQAPPPIVRNPMINIAAVRTPAPVLDPPLPSKQLPPVPANKVPVATHSLSSILSSSNQLKIPPQTPAITVQTPQRTPQAVVN